MTTLFRVLDAELELAGPAAVIAPIAAAYSRFAVPAAQGTPVPVALDAERDEIRVGPRRLPLIPDLDPTVQLYQQFLAALMDHVGSHAILHAAALEDRNGGTLLLAGPSGHGKSSLTLALAAGGLGFLSDDYAPVDLARREVHPYPRRVAVLPGGTAPIPGVFSAAARDPRAPRLFEKALLDVGDVLGGDAMCAGPRPLRHVFILSGARASDRPHPTLIDVGVRETGADSLERVLLAVPGVTRTHESRSSGLRHWRLSIDHELRPTEALSSLLVRDEVLFCEKHWAARPEFDAAPEIEPIKRRQAAEVLGRELLNRREGSRLLQRYGGRLPALFLDLAAALREAACWRLKVGRYTETAALIDRHIG